MNWGNKLLIVFGVFAIGMGTLVYKCMNVKFDLVSKDYYKDELRYQDKIDGMKNASQIGEINVSENDRQVIIAFPAEVKGYKIKADAWFYCKTNADLDRRLTLSVNDDGTSVIDKNLLLKQDYQLKLSWETGDKKYYTEKDIKVN
ncbi:FixH family protein [Danxiaibacter flavus]|uniref:FixH family protein n=1 Tax=Danxiaibacter flavus TaxID=3049108 RepID=A0ABV3Z841_9BACT|nr:FixH family protein [Chitinophagaceae bacterium DXS]